MRSIKEIATNMTINTINRIGVIVTRETQTNTLVIHIKTNNNTILITDLRIHINQISILDIKTRVNRNIKIHHNIKEVLIRLEIKFETMIGVKAVKEIVTLVMAVIREINILRTHTIVSKTPIMAIRTQIQTFHNKIQTFHNKIQTFLNKIREISDQILITAKTLTVEKIPGIIGDNRRSTLYY
jgi:uncharacterized coiled-coil DUF342 family protein